MNIIPYGRQEVTKGDINSVVDVLCSDFLTQGPQVPKFENCIADYCGAGYAVATNSATSALHLSCLALGLGPSDWLWTSPITFVASANCGLYCGAKIDFVDIDPDTYNMCPRALERKLIEAQNLGKLPKIVIPVHLCGQPCDMQSIHALSIKYDFKIIEDASHAIGARYKNEHVGNCKYSDITVFSFHPVKIITTGEGGVAITNNVNLSRKMSLLRSHGITRELDKMTQDPDGPWYYQQIALGYNYRITDLQAALGISQMKRLDDYVTRRHEIAKCYDERLAKLPITTPYQSSDSYSAFHLYVIRLQQLENKKIKHSQVFKKFHDKGIKVNLHYIPVHTQPYYKNLGFSTGDYPMAEAYYSDAISLPIYPSLTVDQQNKVISTIQEVI